MDRNDTMTVAPEGVLPAEQWGELHDFLTLALDALGERPEDFSPDFLKNCVTHQRLGLKLTHDAMRKIGGEA
ncbi:hypothetical protein JT55_10275 [Rhodovulum sp. NI22]|nr:hypothetical protein JT55_10275 [Rhodovulum sp. NI22]